MVNMLEPGAGGAPSAKPRDDKANPLVPAPRQSKMMQHFGSQLDAADARFKMVKEAQTRVAAQRQGLDSLVALQDTVTTQDVVKACAGMVAAGIPAVEIAGVLADMPEGGSQLQAWIAQQDQAVHEREDAVNGALADARHQLIGASLTNLIAHSAEAKMMAQPAQGRA